VVVGCYSPFAFAKSWLSSGRVRMVHSPFAFAMISVATLLGTWA
jgi:hypothetical protein